MTHRLQKFIHFLNGLGAPHKRLPPVLHVTGTNGKGSTIAFLRAIFEAAGYRVHTFTSPHLCDVRERIVLAGEVVPYERWAGLNERLDAQPNAGDLQWFERLTALGFLAFSETPADVLLLEVGIGGRLDYTNVIPAPLAALFTPISLDHTLLLGETLQEIALEKSGIIKPGARIVSAPQPPEVLEILRSEADQQGGSFLEATPCTDRTLGLKGEFQKINAGVALATIATLQGHFDVPESAQIKGLAAAHWPGRFQEVRSGAATFIVDGAHNVGGAEALVQALRARGAEEYDFIIGMHVDKNAEAFLEILRPLMRTCTFVPLADEKSWVRPDLVPLAQALEIARSRRGTTVVTGSLYLVGEVLSSLNSGTNT